MAYEIPQELEYKEKIIFGLTMRQVGTLVIFLVVSFLFYTQTRHSSSVKVTVVILLGILCIGFLYLDLWSKLKNFFMFIKDNNIEFGTFKMDTFLGIKDIKEELI